MVVRNMFRTCLNDSSADPADSERGDGVMLLQQERVRCWHEGKVLLLDSMNQVAWL